MSWKFFQDSSLKIKFRMDALESPLFLIVAQNQISTTSIDSCFSWISAELSIDVNFSAVYKRSDDGHLFQNIFFFLFNVVSRAATTSELQCNWALALCFSLPANGLSSARGAIHHMHYLKSGASIKIRTVKKRWMALVSARHHLQMPKLNLEILLGSLD